ncbi:MAG: UDP-N-acetylmuramoyl-L-alanine--D-glutamate ligase [Clostridia bacterium]|nr:UDP-N-acetylmuramoyl-L-alanine--D-glutamate ligase [Clostridia bacterium]
MQRVLVWGMAKSGIAAAKLLCQKGLYVRINDLKTRESLKPDIDALDSLKLDDRLGEDVLTLLDDVDTLVISPGIPADHKAANLARQKGIEVISEIELAWRFSKGFLVGVTGTNGKTTTTTLIGEIFRAAGRDTKVVGNIGEPYSAHAGETTDESVTVCELSSFQLETISSFRPDISLILNLTEDHLNRHKTIENYAHIKERVFMNQQAGDALVLNYDDPITRDMAHRAKCDVYWFSRSEEVEKGAFVRDGMVMWNDGNTVSPILPAKDIRIPGKHNLENALAAAAAAMIAGIPAETVVRTLRTFSGVEHRIETVCTKDGITYINDSKGTNPDSTIKAVETMTAPTVIILGGSVKNSDYAPMAKVIVNSKVKRAVLIGDTAQAIEKALREAGFTDIANEGYDFEAAVRRARDMASEGWNVLLSPACASFDMFRDFEHRGEEFKRITLGF